MTQIDIKQNIHKHRTQNFRRISPFGIAPDKKILHIRLGQAGIVDHSVDLSISDLKKKCMKKEWTEAIKLLNSIEVQNSKYMCQMATWQHAAHTTYQLTSPCC